jgi:uncharacterized protein
MKNPLDHGVVLVTGASAGIGQELARACAGRARVVVLLARRQRRLDALAVELRARHPELVVDVVRCDLADLAALEQIVAGIEARHGAIDVLINNAGAGHNALLEATSWPAIERVIQLNAVVPMWLIHRVLPGMVDRASGGILNIGSGAGVTAMPGEAAYTSSKHFVHGLSSTLTLELEGTGVWITEVLPGPVRTEFDEVAGIGEEGGGLPHGFRITAERCACDAIDAFDRRAPVCYPGTAYRWLMRVRGAIPARLERRTMRKRARALRGRN